MERDDSPEIPQTKEEIRDFLGIKPGFILHLLGIGWIIGPLLVLIIYDYTGLSFYSYFSMTLMGICGIFCLIMMISTLKVLISFMKEIIIIAKLPEQERKTRSQQIIATKRTQWISDSLFPTILGWIIAIIGLIIILLEYYAII
ncbi:MAG: hypothetical protein JW776_12835 [Candidatus Lokiarchaeota archaeon]|nr:hypothetical protein [Candidatus Lokiarchaeota archaeon]